MSMQHARSLRALLHISECDRTSHPPSVSSDCHIMGNVTATSQPSSVLRSASAGTSAPVTTQTATPSSARGLFLPRATECDQASHSPPVSSVFNAIHPTSAAATSGSDIGSPRPSPVLRSASACTGLSTPVTTCTATATCSRAYRLRRATVPSVFNAIHPTSASATSGSDIGSPQPSPVLRSASSCTGVSTPVTTFTAISTSARTQHLSRATECD